METKKLPFAKELTLVTLGAKNMIGKKWTNNKKVVKA